MLNLLPKIPLFIVSRQLERPLALPVNLTITPSPRCNSRCLTCNIWKQRVDELSLDEWGRIFDSLGHAPFWVTISGGEPFLYRNLVSLCRKLYERCRPAIINIPTNSLLYGSIPDQVSEICHTCTDSKVIINLSLDGVGDKHDRIRGVPGNFERFEANYRALRRLDCPNLTIGIHSVISRFNVADTPELFQYALSMRPDSYITEIAEQRVELGTTGMDITPTKERYEWAIDQLIARIERSRFAGISRITEGFRVEYYRLVKHVMTEQRQVIPCFAGLASVQIFANGDVWPCCIRADKMGNLRDVACDFRKVWSSRKARQVRHSIVKKECHCPLANASYTNMLMHVPTLVRVATMVLIRMHGFGFASRKHETRTDRVCDERAT